MVVRTAYDVDNRQWVASTLTTPSLVVRAPQYPQARRRIRRLVHRNYGRDIQLADQLELPPDLSRKLRRFQRRQALWRALAAFVREERMLLAYDLLDLQMSQADVAALLEISPAQLGALLERNLAAEVAPNLHAAE